MEFMGKYTFQSTNSLGPRKYLTSASSQGMTYPLVAADTATQIERWILYQDDAGALVVQMGNLFYLASVEEVGWIVGTASLDDAFAFRLTQADGGTVSLQIFLSDQNTWAQVFYAVDTITPYLEFVLAGGMPTAPGVYQTLAQATITPSLASIQASKNAQGYDFRNVDLTGADLSGIDFTGADFTSATLDGAKLAGATLAGATLVNASLANTSLAGCTLDGADFSKCNVSTVVWGHGISAQQTRFIGCVGEGCKIGSPDPHNRADFTGADFTGADFTGADFTNALLTRATMVGAVFVGATFEAVDFSGAQLGGLIGTSAATLAFAYLPNVVFSKANLFGVDFGFSSLFGASTSISDASSLEQADFSNAYLEGISLKGARLQGAKFNNACLVNVDFTGAVLSPTLSGSVPATLAGACIQGATFTGATLTQTELTSATVSFGNGTINVRYCNPLVHGPFPPPPSYEPLNHGPTAGLNLSTMVATTVCPNGLTVAANQQVGNTLQQMLTITNPATSWVPVRCASAPGTAGELPYRPAMATPAPTSAARRLEIILETPDAVLRSPHGFRLSDLRALTRDPEARHAMFWNMELGDAQLRSLVHHYRLQQKRKGFSAWPAFRKADRTFIGIFQLTDNPLAGGVEINVAVMPELRGDPVVKEIYRAVLGMGFGRLGLERILGLVEATNGRALRFMDKIGFRYLRDMTIEGVQPMRLYEIRRGDLRPSSG